MEVLVHIVTLKGKVIMCFLCHLYSLVTYKTAHCAFLHDIRYLRHQLPNYLTLNELISDCVCVCGALGYGKNYIFPLPRKELYTVM